jgi:integrase
MTEEQAGKVLRAAAGRAPAFVKVVRLSVSRCGATHAAREDGELACGNRSRTNAPVTEISGAGLAEVTCRACRSVLDTDESPDVRLEALFVLSITLGLRPGELRRLTWDLVDLDAGVIHVWRSASRTGDVKTLKSKRSLTLPKRPSPL